MGTVSTIPEKCKRCYACVRECPAKAIKVEHGQALVIEQRCIGCGNCVKVCTQNAKAIRDSIEEVTLLLADTHPAFACLAPSFPAAFNTIAPGKLITAIRRLGFREVWSVAFGAELVAREYAKLFAGASLSGPSIIATPCPALVAYVEKYIPQLRSSLAPVVSPMIAVARAMRYRNGADISIVFIGPCIAKKDEINDPYVVGQVDSVLTYRELAQLLDKAGIDPDALEETDFDGPKSQYGGSFPLSGGLLKTAGVKSDILDNEIVVAEGKERALVALEELAEGKSHARFLDVLFCEGCISGPRMLNDLGLHARKEILADYVNRTRSDISAADFERWMTEYERVHLGRSFSRQNLLLPIPAEEDIQRALGEMKKFRPEDQLNCGACGYPSCREKAIAVCQGLAEASMCLPYLVEELEDTCEQLESSRRELESAQQRLVHTERLASMGQLSAGVAHEINNPLGTVLIYSHMLLKQLRADEASRADIEMIVNEATRCKRIVRGLLDFARQSRVSKAPTDPAALVHEVMVLMTPRAREKGVQLDTEIAQGLPTMMLDPDQIKQMLVNLVGNAIDAITDSQGRIITRVFRRGNDGPLILEVEDNGVGIPQEHLDRLFTPFFTTKEIGKGTGLGLAIAYGIVKMHSGDIGAQSEMGKGTKFTVSLPVEAAPTSAP